MVENLIVRPMDAADMDLAVEWAVREGWNPGLADARCFRGADPDGFLVGELDGVPVSCISVVRYGESFGFLGFYIVAPGYRGQGLGLTTWQAGMNRLQGRNIGLDGVVDQQANYRKSGFKLAHRNVRYQGTTGQVSASNSICQLEPGDDLVNEILAYDCGFFAEDRKTFTLGWLAESGHRVIAALDKTSLVGYGVIRPCRQGYKVGPLFAEDGEVALAILGRLTGDVESGQQFYLDVPEPNRAALDMVNGLDMSSVFETARMYSIEDPGLPVTRIFGITSFELG